MPASNEMRMPDMNHRLRPILSLVVISTVIWGVIELLALQRARWSGKHIFRA